MISDIQFLINLNNNKPIKPPVNKVSDYIQGNRILPPNTPFPGLWDNAKTPYTVEIMDNMSPSSDIQHTVVMKGAQLGFTASAENIIAYYMDEYPTEILFVTATEPLLEKWAIKRLDPMIDSMGFREKIFAQTENKFSRRLGDKIFTKEYIGGTLDMASAQSAASLRSESKRILVRDEIDAPPPNLRTGEGNWLEVSYARTLAWGHRKKILDLSTPTLFDSSQIYNQYLLGDQRKLFINCLHCKKAQVLFFDASDKNKAGLKPDFKAGILQEAYYICEHCHKPMFNYQKPEILKTCKWVPTAKTTNDGMRTYHINSLYSPNGMLSWTEFYQKYLDSQEKPDGARSFTNLYLGEPYRERGARPKLDKVIELRGYYKEKTIQDGALYLTAGIDVQAGSEKNEKNPPRLEMEVLAHGYGYRTWQVLYKTFNGPVDDPFAGAWEKLNEFAKNNFVYQRKDGKKFIIQLVFIDSGDGNLTDVVYRFTERWKNTYPSKGFSALKVRKGEKLDEQGPANFRRYRAARVGQIILYEISTNYYKNNLYNNLKIERQDGSWQKPGFCDFPRAATEDYFRQLTAEEKRRDGSFYAGGRRNEAMDTRVMNMCAGDVYLDSLVIDARARAKANGADAVAIQKINARYALETLKKNISNKY